MDNNNQLLEKYLRNERINQRVTTGMVLGFLVLAVFIVHLGLQTKILKNEIDQEKLNFALLSDSLKRVVDLQETIIQNKDFQLQSLLVDSNNQTDKLKKSTETDDKDLIWEEEIALIDSKKLTLENLNQDLKVVYVQYKNQLDWEYVKKFLEELQEEGFIIREPEKVELNFKSSIRFFHKSDEQDAIRLKELLSHDTKLNEIEITSLYNMNAPANQLEIWINLNEDGTSTKVGKMLPPTIEASLPSNKIVKGQKRF